MMKYGETLLGERETLKQHLLIVTSLDIILNEKKWLRVHRYEPDWLPEAALGIIDNGAGDNVYIVFASEGVVIKGFDHLSPMSPHAGEVYGVWPGIYEQTPKKLLAYLKRDADSFDIEDVTFCLWRETGDLAWQIGDNANPEGLDDGSDFLLSMLQHTPEEYADWAKSYYSKPIPIEVVRQVYSGAAITGDIVATLNPKRDVQAALKELEDLGGMDDESTQ